MDSTLSPPTDASSDSGDSLRSADSVDAEASKADVRAYSWSFSAAVRLDLSAAASNPSARIELAKQMVTASLRREHRHHILHMVAQFSADEIRRNSEPTVLVAVAGYVQLERQARESNLRSWLPEPVMRTSWERMPGGLCANPVFQQDTKKPDSPWIKLFVVGELALNNCGREEKKVQTP